MRLTASYCTPVDCDVMRMDFFRELEVFEYVLIGRAHFELGFDLLV